jgi:hypothetical protein
LQINRGPGRSQRAIQFFSGHLESRFDVAAGPDSVDNAASDLLTSSPLLGCLEEAQVFGLLGQLLGHGLQ